MKKGFFRRVPKKTITFSIGSRCKIEVPESAKNTHGPFDGASVRIVSKKHFLSKHPIEKIELSKVVCRILEAPNAPYGVKVVGLEYPIRRSWLVEDGHECICDYYQVINKGCICGGY